MAKKKNPHVGRSLQDFVAEQRAEEPEFAAAWDSLQLARRVRALREANRMTQQELATRAQTTQSAIARLESGRVIPRLDLLQKIATAMGLSLSVDLVARRKAKAA